MASIYEDESHAFQNLRIVLLGASGVGKSATGNAILGREAFKETTTTMTEVQRGRVEDRNISVIDTPGFFNTELTDEDLHIEMMKSLSLSHPGPHVFLLIVKLDTYTEDNARKIVEKIQESFGEEVLKFTLVLFTGREKIYKKECDQFIESERTKEFLSYFKGRFHTINSNIECTSKQIMKLVRDIDNLVKNNEGQHFTKYYTSDNTKRTQQKQLKPRRTELIIFVGAAVIVGAALLFLVGPKAAWKTAKGLTEGGLKAAKGLTEGGLKAAKGLTEGGLKAAKGLTEGGLKAAKGLTEGGLKAAKGLTEGGLKAAKGLTEGGLKAAKGLTEGGLKAAKGLTEGGLKAAKGLTEGGLKAAKGLTEGGLKAAKGLTEGGLKAAKGLTEGGLKAAKGLTEGGLKAAKGLTEGGLKAAKGLTEGGLKAAKEQPAALKAEAGVVDASAKKAGRINPWTGIFMWQKLAKFLRIATNLSVLRSPFER